ncbi:stage V sporulation protein AC [Carboxydothermus ferrireducens]|uniref:Stage V sporulation protein AC n=1 Tax=Carboxydothermus ferrireducens DSM 11255 TaxID=1119529 RepID=A0ABX2RCK3_9THEO|nr:stage V sporulation protein AC [Carboxydothermus ferrireducens]NYE58670.1 stage V sporulation protein AC [Carboxydothermus ferrireducens DSM 11255]
MAIDKNEYQKTVEKIKPKPPVLKNCLLAFLMGGFVCLLGEVLFHFLRGYGLSEKDGYTVVSVVFILISAILTGTGIYDDLVRIFGAGLIVPITGFANSMVSPALEHKQEGLVLGVGAKLFTVAGPVIIYGVLSSLIVAIILRGLGKL